MTKQVIFTSGSINDISQLKAAIDEATSILRERKYNPHCATMVDTLRLQVIEETYPTGYTAYDIRLIEE